MTADSIARLGTGLHVADDRASLCQALKHISGLCPSLPEKVAEGPLPP
jgi:hypothetical protein